MPFYLVTQKGIPGGRLIESEKPQGALQHVIADQFEVKRVDGRELLDAAKQYEPESALQGVADKQAKEEPEKTQEQNTDLGGSDNEE
jgi:hypothetical protein